MNTTNANNLNIPPLLSVNCPIGSAEFGSSAMCIPGAIAGAFFCGAVGCFYGAVKSVSSGTALATLKSMGGAKGLIAMESQNLAGRTIAPCIVDTVSTGFHATTFGCKHGAALCGAVCYLIPSYQNLTGQRLPDIRVNFPPSPMPDMERT